jgi:hypothetical protein
MFNHITVRQNCFNSNDLMSRRTESQNIYSPSIGCNRPTNRRRSSSSEINRIPQSMNLGRFMNLFNSDARPNRNLLTDRVNWAERIQTPSGDNHMTFISHSSTHQPGISTLGYNCDVVLRAQLENLTHLTRGRWTHNDRGRANETTRPIGAIATEIARQDMIDTDHPLQTINEL